MPSLFEEQIQHEEIQLSGAFDTGADSFAEALTYLPEFERYDTGASVYLRHLEDSVSELEIPVISSLNGMTVGDWVGHARRMQDAGAAAIELNG